MAEEVRAGHTLMAENRLAPSDAESLLPLARAGSGRALGQLLEQHRNYLRLLARLQIGRYLQSKVDADDLVQDAFLEAHRNFGLFRGQSAAEFLAWLRQILAATLANLVRRYVGTKGRDVRLERDIAAGMDQSSRILDGGLVDSQSSPSQRAARSEQAVLLADTLAGLPEDYREVIMLRQLQGLPFAEVAQHMGRSEDSVQKLWVRALASLRRLLGSST
jgi:RNA polymerase sigma-70 factor (ECF subfamily)